MWGSFKYVNASLYYWRWPHGDQEGTRRGPASICSTRILGALPCKPATDMRDLRQVGLALIVQASERLAQWVEGCVLCSRIMVA